MQLDLNKPLLELDGTELAEKLNRVLADILKRSPSGDAIKFLDWAIDLWKVGWIIIDNSDYEAIRACVQQSQTWAMARAQILKEMAAQKEGKAGTRMTAPGANSPGGHEDILAATS